MLADPLDVLDAYLSGRAGRLAVAVASLVIAGLLWTIDSRVLKVAPSYAGSEVPRRNRKELIRHWEALAIHGCLRLLCLAAALLAVTYLVEAFLGKG